ncbi:MAG: hypothetical protein QM759_01020 [Terricaulis sp.]
MTADDKLAAFFALQEPPAFDARFMLRTLEAFQKREARKDQLMVALVGVVTLIVAVFVGDRLAVSVNTLLPALAPAAVVATALYLMGMMPGVRRQW